MDSYEYNLLLGRNEHCDKLLEEVKDMNEGQGNYHFCFVSDLAAKVMKRELFNSIAPPEEPPWSGMNHRRRCDMFWEKHKKEFKHVKNAMNIEW
jgi:hypothetical protein